MPATGQRARAVRARPAPRPPTPAAVTELRAPHGLRPLQLSAAAALPALAAFVLYIPALHGGFIWDDPLVLQQIQAIHSFGDLLVPPAIIPKYYFRPLIFLTYLADAWVAGNTPFAFHLSVIAFHVLNTLLVFALAQRLFRADWMIASGAALLFAVTPIHVESVAWMAGRSDVIAGSGMLLTVLLATRREAWASWVGGLTCLLALLAKESAIVTVALVPLFDLLSIRRLRWHRYVPLLLATAAYLGLRQHALGTPLGGMASPRAAIDLAVDVVSAVGFYVVNAIVPVTLQAYIPEVPRNPLFGLIGVAVFVGTVWLLVVALRQRRWRATMLAAFFVLTLAPSLLVILRRSASAVVADRYLYVPSVASSILLAWALVRGVHAVHRKRLWAALAIAVIGVTYAVQALRYTAVWADDLSFWSDLTRKAPDATLPHLELATALEARNQSDAARRELEAAVRGHGEPEEHAMAYNNLGNLYRRSGELASAERAFGDGLRLRTHPTLYHNLGMTLMMLIQRDQTQHDGAAMQRDLQRARDAFEQALALGTAGAEGSAFPQWDPAKTHALLGQVLFSLGAVADARSHLETALRLEPSGPIAEATRRFLQQLPPP